MRKKLPQRTTSHSNQHYRSLFESYTTMLIVFCMIPVFCQHLFAIIFKPSNPCSTGEIAGDFPTGDRSAQGYIGQRGSIHYSGDVISCVKKHPAKATDRFLGTSLVTGHRNTPDWGQNPIEMAHHFAHGDLTRALCQHISASNARRAFHPPLRLQVEHDLFKKSLRHVIPASQFPNRNRRPAMMVHQCEQSPQRVIRFL